VVATPFVSSPMATINEEEVHVFQEPVVTHVEEKQQPPIQNVSHDEPLRRSQRVFLMTMSYMLAKKFKLRVIPPHLKKS
jgi:hypothetical protein